jgi:2-aminoethylphosphonate-pyruvate transaminase
MIKAAVILAAGLGSRLKDRTKLHPKGFLEIDGLSLIERSVNRLLSIGVERIYIGTGYLSEVYDEYASNYKEIKTIKSDRFKETSSMYTLYNMRDSINEDFLLLESDLLYEQRALEILVNDSRDDIVLSSGKTESNDEVYIEVDKDNYLLNLSKDKKELNSIDSELVGISKISLDRYKNMCDIFADIMYKSPKIDYEHIMVKSSKVTPFYVKKVEDLVWCEIDDESHLKRAINKILPKIKD